MEPIETFINNNLSSLSETLSQILENPPSTNNTTNQHPTNNEKDGGKETEVVLPWVLEFSSDLYTKVVHFSLQKMIHDTEKVFKSICDCKC